MRVFGAAGPKGTAYRPAPPPGLLRPAGPPGFTRAQVAAPPGFYNLVNMGAGAAGVRQATNIQVVHPTWIPYLAQGTDILRLLYFCVL